MSENSPRYYDGDHPCPLAGSGRCCKDKHKADVNIRIAHSSRMIETGANGNLSSTKLAFEPIGKSRLFARAEMWQTQLGFNRNLTRQLELTAINTNRNQLARILDLSWTKTAVHTPANHDCPLLELLREHKI